MLKKKSSHISAASKKLAALAKGIQNGIPPTVSLALNGAMVSQPDLLTQIAAQEAPIDVVTQKRADLETAIDQRRTTDLARSRFIAAVRGAIISYLGRTNPELTQFGINPAKDQGTIPSAEAQARAQKAKQTREKNGTLGKRQKQALDASPATPPVAPPKSAT